MGLSTRAETLYRGWLADERIDEATKAELRALEGQHSEIEDRFFKDLEFGTAGMRGVMGAGTNRMNVYTVGRATQGLARYLSERAAEQGRSGRLSVAIAYDSRRMSREFALEAALVLAGNGIAAYLFDSLRPTPVLSFAVRHLRADGGIVVTASHNPPEYNGYKVYGPDGGQLVPEDAEQVIRHILAVDLPGGVRKLDREEAERQGLLRWIGQEVDDAYIEAVKAASPDLETVRQTARSLRVVYTPLHGAGNLPLRRALSALGFSDVHVVPEQERPDPDFSTVPSPNPEEKEALLQAVALAQRIEADLVIGTDPDCDRMGAAVRGRGGDFVALTGNQCGALMLEYLLGSLRRVGRLPANGAVVQTIVTSELGADVARHYGSAVFYTLTGFKYIGEKMNEFARDGRYTFLFGYEESCGFLAGTHARDKDGVVASTLLCEAAAYYKSIGRSLLDVLEDLYRRFGYCTEALESRSAKGKEGMALIGALLDDWRQHPPADAAGLQVAEALDYSLGLEGLPRENVLKYKLADGSWFCLRPSGTEPKMKVYFSVRGSSSADAEAKLSRLKADVMSRVDDFLRKNRKE